MAMMRKIQTNYSRYAAPMSATPRKIPTMNNRQPRWIPAKKVVSANKSRMIKPMFSLSSRPVCNSKYASRTASSRPSHSSSWVRTIVVHFRPLPRARDHSRIKQAPAKTGTIANQ